MKLTKSIKLVVFDADGVLWQTKPGDYLSKVKSEFKLVEPGVVIREKDGAIFQLRKEIPKILTSLHTNSILCGLASDNKASDVITTCKLLDIWKFFKKSCVVIRLYKGYCPKHEMILEILGKLVKEGIKLKTANVLWLDDRDYTKEAKEIGVNFLQISPKGRINLKLLYSK